MPSLGKYKDAYDAGREAGKGCGKSTALFIFTPFGILSGLLFMKRRAKSQR